MTVQLPVYIVAIVVAWLVAHVIKYIIAGVRHQKLDFTHQLFVSGGMPSSHAATSVAVWVVVLLTDGYQSAVFGLATLVTLIICYDAVKVRRSVGEQGEALQALIKKGNTKIALPRAARGHTPLEVVAGAILGVLVGCVVFIATK
jgi:acid phosphatase family membrane protein YuiD